MEVIFLYKISFEDTEVSIIEDIWDELATNL